MVVFNYSTRELTTKVVYYGPGLCGKTTNLQFIYDHMPQGVRGKMLSLATKSDRTLFFDFLPIDLGQIQGMKTKVQLYTVPGQVFYNETRRLVLKGADGVVFVADSQENMLEANLDSFRNLEENLQAHGLVLADLPHVLQFNKRDLPTALPVESLNEKLNKYNMPFYEAIATTGVGVQETLRHISKLVLLKLNERYGTIRPSAAPKAAAPPPPPRPVAPPPRPVEMPTIAVAPAPDFAFAEPGPPRAPAPPRAETPAPAVAAAPSAALVEDQVSFSLELPSLEAAPSGPAGPGTAPGAEDMGFDFAPSPPAGPPPAPAQAESLFVPEKPVAVQAAPEPPSTLEDLEPMSESYPQAAAPVPEPMELFPAQPPAPQRVSPAEDEDILGVVPAWTPPETTLRMDREELERVVQEAPLGAVAVARAEEVSAADPLFHEDGLEPTRLSPGRPQDILIPLEIQTAQGLKRFRLTLRLEMNL